MTEQGLPQGTLTCFIPGGHVRPFVQYAKFSDRTESVTKNMYKKIGIHDYIIIVQLGKFCDRTESATRNVSMFIPAGHVRPFCAICEFLVTERSLPQGTLTCLSPQGMLDLLSHVGNLVTERSLPPGSLTCLSLEGMLDLLSP